MKTSIVTTTIYVPHTLRKFAENARSYGHSEVEFVVIGDRKTPAETRTLCEQIAREFYPTVYLDIDDQRVFLDAFPELWSHLRFDSIQRRNVGLLYAWQSGAGLIITIDDDNFVMNQDFIGLHAKAGGRHRLPVLESTSGWYNVCSTLIEEHGQPFYHRGYPVGQRWNEADAFVSESVVTRRVAVNAGFWLDDPDIDALTRLHRQPLVRGLSRSCFALEPGTWSPFNSQNTALARDVVPAYFLGPYIGRYDDIWPSYLVTRIAQHLGDVIAFGEPVVRQQRNVHDIWKDLDNERNGMLMTDDLCAALRRLKLTGTTYHECYGEIASRLGEEWHVGERWSESMREWRSRYLEGMRIWHGAFEKLQRGRSLDRLAGVIAAERTAQPEFEPSASRP
jgi:hypothetical protein